MDIKIPTHDSNANLIVGIAFSLVVVVLLSVGLSPIAELMKKMKQTTF